MKASTKKTATKKALPKKTVRKKKTTLEVGQKAPGFSLSNERGEKIDLADLKGKKVVLYFYPKDHTPGCTQESCDFRDQFARVKKTGAVVFGVSRDSIASHDSFKTKLGLPFSLLSDEAGEACEAYGVWKEKSMYGRKYMGIERTTFIIDESGTLKKIYPKVSVTGHVDEVLSDLKD